MPPKQTKTPAESVQEMGKEITKEAIRKTVWNYLEDNDLVQFPRPVHHRIPNFMGAAAAAEKMASLDEFKRAQTVKINPDKPQENARFLTMEAEKTLLVPTPRLRHGLFNKLLPPEACGKEILRYCSTSQGLKEYSVPMGLEAKIKVDLVVIGSVAVTKTGFRIGKGEGFADLEYAMMCAMGAVNQDTIVVTTVHDSQVVDIPESLMEEHDVIVDYIVTDTEVIKCNKTRPKPTGVIWSKLTPEKVRQVPILKFLREKEREAGKDVTLKDGREEEDIPEREDRKYDSDMGRPRYGRNRRFRRFPRRGPPRQGRGDSGDYPRDSQENGVEDGNEEGDDDRSKQQRPRYRRNRRFRRRGGPRRREESDRYDESHEEDQDHEEDEERDNAQPRRRNMRRRRPRRRNESENTGDDEEKENRRPRRRRNPRSRAPIPTIFVGSIQRSVRVSELKTEIRGKDVNPIRVIWNGAKGYSLLQFQEMQEMESALDALQDLEIRGRKLRVEMSNRLRQGDDRESDQDDYANGAQAARPED